MHFYSKHIGDWVNDTVGLTATEEGVYGRLTDQYFKRERPLPLDQGELYRLARASTKDERKAVDYVVPALFVREADGWHRETCDGAIGTYQQRAETARQNGQRGGRPKNQNRNQNKTDPEPSGFSVGSDQEPSSKANHKPVTINHASDPADLAHPSDAVVVVPPVDAFPKTQSVTESPCARVDGVFNTGNGDNPTQGSVQKKRCANAAVSEVFAYWQQVMGHPRALANRVRVNRINDRLRDGYTVSDLMRAIDGCKASPYHRGQNVHGTIYDDIELICRDGPHVEQFMNRDTAASAAASRLGPVGRQAAETLAGWAARHASLDEEKANGTEGP